VPSPIVADDLYRFRLIQSFDLSPDGRKVVYSQQRIDRKTEKKHADLFISRPSPDEWTEPRQLTHGDHRDSAPRFSPDSRSVLFVSNRDDEKQGQVYILPLADGGEARKVTDLKGSIQDAQWMPDGTSLLLSFRRKDAEVVEREADPDRKELGTVCRRITRRIFKFNGPGLLPDERTHIVRVDAATGEATWLTDGPDYDESDPTPSPCGRWVAFVSNRADDPDMDIFDDAIWVIAADGSSSEPRRIPAPKGPKGQPAFSPDGKRLAWFGPLGLPPAGRNRRLWVAPADGSAEARCVTADIDVTLGSGVAGDHLGAIGSGPPIWGPDGRHVLVPVAKRGTSALMWVDVDAAEPELQPFIDDGATVGLAVTDAAATTLVAMRADAANPGELWLQRGGEPARPITRAHAETLADRDLGAVEAVDVPRPDDHDRFGPIHGWIMTPPGFDPAQRYPAILQIHGGPHTQYGVNFMHEFQQLAGAGYVIGFCNPRGSSGYGEAHTQAVIGDWGGPDFRDVIAFADHLADLPYVDADRLGVTGGSYGGYMTSMIIGRDHRFKAAVVQRAVTNAISKYGSTDIHFWTEIELGDGEPPWMSEDRLLSYWRQSPMAYVKDARTPTLIIHSEQDWRCHIEQSEQLLFALKRLGVPTELIRFPGENHELSRSGRTDRRIARLTHMQRWFDTWLK
jgi:dipeptidyl aminopeptidase/acylaminoacyl peptidase